MILKAKSNIITNSGTDKLVVRILENNADPVADLRKIFHIQLHAVDLNGSAFLFQQPCQKTGNG